MFTFNMNEWREKVILNISKFIRKNNSLKRQELKKNQKRLKQYLKGKMFYNEIENKFTKKQKGIPYIKLKTKKRVSFTQELRNKKGYNEYLIHKYNLN